MVGKCLCTSPTPQLLLYTGFLEPSQSEHVDTIPWNIRPRQTNSPTGQGTGVSRAQSEENGGDPSPNKRSALSVWTGVKGQKELPSPSLLSLPPPQTSLPPTLQQTPDLLLRYDLFPTCVSHCRTGLEVFLVTPFNTRERCSGKEVSLIVVMTCRGGTQGWRPPSAFN